MNSRLFQTILVTLGAIVTVSSTDIFLPSLPDIARCFEVTAEEAQLSIPICLLGAFISSPILGSLSDHYGRKPLLLAGTILFFCGSVACTLSSSLPIFLLARFIQGTGSVASFVIGWAVVQELYPGDGSAKIMSWLGSIVGGAPLLAPTLGGWIHVIFGWRANFLLISACTALLFICIYFSNPPAPASKKILSPKALFQSYVFILKDKIFFLYLSFFILLACGQWCYLTFIPFYFENSLHLSPNIFGVYISGAALLYILGTFTTPLILNFLGVSQTIALGLVLSLAGGVGTLGLSIFLPTSPFSLTLTIGTYLFGIGIIWGPSSSRAFQRFENTKGAAAAVRGLLLTVFFSVGSLIGGLCQESLLLLSLFLISMSLGCWVSFYALKKHGL